MDKFSELIDKGVAPSRYTPVASPIPTQDIVCREYNNVFGAATDTHMSELEGGGYVITGHLIANKVNFDRFLWACQYLGVDFRHSGYWCLSNWMYKFGLRGEYSVLNGDVVYIVKKMEAPEKSPVINNTYTTESSIIPVNIKYMSTRGDIEDIKECIKDDMDSTIKSLNESRYVRGKNWYPVYTSDGLHLSCQHMGVNYFV